MERSPGEVHFRPHDQVLLQPLQNLHPGGTRRGILRRRLQQVFVLEREQAGGSVVAGEREQGVPHDGADELEGRVEEDEKVAPTVPKTRGSPTLRSHHGQHRTDPLFFPLGQPHPSHSLSLGQKVHLLYM